MLKRILLCIIALNFQTNIAQNLDESLEAIFNQYSLMGLSVWVATHNNVETHHYGYKDFHRNLLIDDFTKFRIASISKSFTALGLLKLHDDGHFNLDDDISTVLGFSVRNPEFPSIPITYRMLLSHQSSLQDGSGYAPFLAATLTNTPQPNIAELILPNGEYYSSNMWRLEEPGSYFTYSNINFGLIGALIEMHSGQRFDVFMKSEILIPLGITGSFNIQDLPNLNDLGVIYRNQNGWQPQIDNYEGIYPTPPDLSNYIPGTNGVYFAPQGGLRVSAKEIGIFTNFLKNNGVGSTLQISSSTLEQMKEIVWNYNGENGDNYFGLFNRWGLGLHHANVTTGDQICNLGNYGTFLGHPGEAYGLVSDTFFEETRDLKFTLLINGISNGYVFGDNSSFYSIEEAIFEALCHHFEYELNTLENTILKSSISPNPASKLLQVDLEETTQELDYVIYTVKGSKVALEKLKQTNNFTINLENLESGLYFLYIKNSNKYQYHKFIIE